jgi:hypothetical protein
VSDVGRVADAAKHAGRDVALYFGFGRGSRRTRAASTQDPPSGRDLVLTGALIAAGPAVQAALGLSDTFLGYVEAGAVVLAIAAIVGVVVRIRQTARTSHDT